MEKVKDKKKDSFWEQFPEGTEQLAFSIEKGIIQTLFNAGNKIPLDEMLNALGIAVGHFLQMSCMLYGYLGEEQIKRMLYNGLKESFEYYQKNPFGD